MSRNVDGVLRCGVCGAEMPRAPKSLTYGEPVKCHGEIMRAVTPLELQQEREYQDRMEEERRFETSAEAWS